MTPSSWFQRLLLPGFAFKAVVIGGGYATGRELAEFFLPSGPRGGLMGMVLAMAIWSLVCVATFLFAQLTGSRDYRSFFRGLLGPAWPVFEVAYALFVVLILSVFAAAAGAIAEAVFGLPKLVGAIALIGAIMGVATFGNTAVERLFKYVSFFLYGAYAVFVVLALLRFGQRIPAQLALATPTTGWAAGGLAYASYNIIGAVVILPVVRHMRGRRDAVIAGLLAGPLAMLPALLFFLCMIAYYPQIGGRTLPSDYLLSQLGLPVFRVVFQLMIFAALLESGTGAVHAINERIAHAWRSRRGRELSRLGRLAAAAVVLTVSVFIADRFGLVALIAKGYRFLAWLFLALYVLPLLTFGVWRLSRGWRAFPLPSPEGVAHAP
ncbi:MAG TPA: hypothetical protein VGG29_14905 [Caulobacteraceae bacterium]|jgi:uncharacterized membrane protein YkvI